MQFHGLPLGSGELITASTSKRTREEFGDDYESDAQVPAKRSKTSRNGASRRCRTKAPKDGKYSVSIGPSCSVPL